MKIKTVTLYSDAKASAGRFAICSKNGEPIWFGRFFETDAFNGEQSSGEKSAALKAIWLASKIKEAADVESLRLKLIVDANWLCTLSGKSAELQTTAARHGIDLAMTWTAGKSNPAEQWTTAKGFKKWDDNDLAALVVETTKEEIETEESVEEEARINRPSSRVKRGISYNPKKPKFDMAGVSEAELNEWLNSHKEEWAQMLAECNAAGMGRRERQEKRAAVVAEWIAAGKPSK